jgi:hypothetical protein
MTSNHNPPTSPYHIAGITSISYCSWAPYI